MSELKTYGDLKKLINGVIKNQKGEKILSKGKEIALDQVLGFIPGASNAKSLFDFIKTAISKPDGQKTDTWLDKLDVDDDMSRIVDDTVENGFMQTMAKIIEKENDTKPLELDFNMNAQMVNYLKQQYNQRTISGIQESNIYNKHNKHKKMKNEQLKKLIKEEIKNLLELDATPSATPSAAPAEAISPSEFNIQLKAIYDQLKMSKAGITGQELELLLSIIKDIVGYTQQNTLSPTLSDRILKITN